MRKQILIICFNSKGCFFDNKTIIFKKNQIMGGVHFFCRKNRSRCLSLLAMISLVTIFSCNKDENLDNTQEELSLEVVETADKLVSFSVEDAAATGSYEGTDPFLAFDGEFVDTSSAWATSVLGDQIVFDLGEARDLEMFQIAFGAGQTRQYNFAVEYLSPSVTVTGPAVVWNLLNVYTSSGNSAMFETFSFKNGTSLEATSARFIRITNLGNDQNDFLNIKEISFTGDDGTDTDEQTENLATGKQTRQSSTDGTNTSDFAVDSFVSSSDGFALTTIETQPWWEVDLGDDYPVGDVKIWTEATGAFDIFFYNSSNTLTFKSTVVSSMVGAELAIHAAGAIATRVRIKMKGDTALNLLEVGVFANSTEDSVVIGGTVSYATDSSGEVTVGGAPLTASLLVQEGSDYSDNSFQQGGTGQTGGSAAQGTGTGTSVGAGSNTEDEISSEQSTGSQAGLDIDYTELTDLFNGALASTQAESGTGATGVQGSTDILAIVGPFWKITLPEDANGNMTEEGVTFPDERNNAAMELFDLNDAAQNYKSVVVADGEVVFTAPTSGATTEGSIYPRCELRGLDASGDDGYMSFSNEQRLVADVRALAVPEMKPEVCMFQIHGPDDEPLRVEYSGDPSIGFHLVVNETETINNVIDYEIGQFVNVDVHILDGTITVNLENLETGETYSTSYVAVDTEGYWKLGCYIQSSITYCEEKGHDSYCQAYEGTYDDLYNSVGSVGVRNVSLIIDGDLVFDASTNTRNDGNTPRPGTGVETQGGGSGTGTLLQGDGTGVEAIVGSFWKVTMPVDASGNLTEEGVTSPDERNNAAVESFNLNDAAESYIEYFSVLDGECIFVAPASGATTEGSIYPRCELRALNSNGDDDYMSFDNEQRLTADVRALSLPAMKPEVCMFQIHGPDDEPLRVEYSAISSEGFHLVINETETIRNVIDYEIGQFVTVDVQISGGTITVDLENLETGETYSISYESVDTEGYWKLGCYVQSSVTYCEEKGNDSICQAYSGSYDELYNSAGSVGVKNVSIVRDGVELH